MSVDKWLAPALAKRIADIRHYAEHVVREVAENHRVPPDIYHYRRVLHDAGFLIFGGQGGLSTIPLLNDDTVAALKDYADHHAPRYCPNPEEDAAYQMAELVLPHGSDAFAEMRQLHDTVLVPIWVIGFGLYPTILNGIQYARYDPGEMARTSWHYDKDSGCTVTVAIENGLGGGMEVFPGTVCTRTPIGTATFFLGRTTLHRSKPVLEGKRQLLVFWTDTEN